MPEAVLIRNQSPKWPMDKYRSSTSSVGATGQGGRHPLCPRPCQRVSVRIIILYRNTLGQAINSYRWVPPRVRSCFWHPAVGWKCFSVFHKINWNVSFYRFLNKGDSTICVDARTLTVALHLSYNVLLYRKIRSRSVILSLSKSPNFHQFLWPHGAGFSK